MLKFLGRLKGKKRAKSSAHHIVRKNDPTLAVLNNYLKAPRPDKNTRLNQVELVAVDFETTGLEPSTDKIISMGFCPISPGAIRLGECEHLIINAEHQLQSENVAIHGLTDDQLKQGILPGAAFDKFMELTANKVIVAHYHSIERLFIQRLARQIIDRPIPLSILDTFMIGKRQMKISQKAIVPKMFRLFNLKKEYGLPNYKAHNALEDAISTAELFLAQLSRFDQPLEGIRLGDLGLNNFRR